MFQQNSSLFEAKKKKGKKKKKTLIAKTFFIAQIGKKGGICLFMELNLTIEGTPPVETHSNGL